MLVLWINFSCKSDYFTPRVRIYAYMYILLLSLRLVFLGRYKWGKNVNNLRTTGTVIDNFDGGGKQRYSHSQMTPCCTGNNGQFFDASWRQNIVAVLCETCRAPRKRYIILYTRTDGLWTRQSYGSPVQQQRRSCRVTTRHVGRPRARVQNGILL